MEDASTVASEKFVQADNPEFEQLCLNVDSVVSLSASLGLHTSL